MTKDFKGQELHLGDTVAFIYRRDVGCAMMLKEGKIVSLGASGKAVTVEWIMQRKPFKSQPFSPFPTKMATVKKTAMVVKLS